MQLPLPLGSLPDCNACEKPELGVLNRQAVNIYSRIGDQQQFNSFTGSVMGLRFEALVAAIEWYTGAGEVQDPDEVMDRVMILDRIACRIKNAKLEQASAAKASN